MARYVQTAEDSKYSETSLCSKLKDSVLVRHEAALQGNRIPTFRQNVILSLLSSNYGYFDS
jgi:hypothetical protein